MKIAIFTKIAIQKRVEMKMPISAAQRGCVDKIGSVRRILEETSKV